MNQFFGQDMSFFKENNEALLDRFLTHFIHICYNCMRFYSGVSSCSVWSESRSRS